MQIRSRLLLLALSILVPAWLAAVYSVWFVYTEQKQGYEESMGEAARALALLVDNELRVKEAALQTLAKSPALRRGELDSFRAFAREVVPGPDEVIVLSALDGQQLVNTRAAAGARLPRVSQAVYTLSSANPDRSIVSGLFVGPVARRKDVAIDIPVVIDGTVRYRMALGFEAASLEKSFRERRTTNWLISIADQGGAILARTENSAQFVGRRANPSLLQRVQAREQSGVIDAVTLDGRPVAAFFHRAPWSSWTVVISVPKTEIQRPARHAALMLAALVIALLGLGWGIAHWYARKTAMPIEALRTAAERLGEGAAVHVTPCGLSEVDLVGAALSRASMLVRRHQAELELRVQEAVTSAERSQRALLQAQKLEALGRLTGGIAHDFNNILQTLTSALQLMSRSADLSLIRRLSETSQRAVARGAALTTQLRAFGRVQDVRLETVAPADALSNAQPLLDNALPANVSLHIEVPADAWPVTVDRLQFELALLNVVINARDAMPSGGEIRLSVANIAPATSLCNLPPGSYVMVRVSDKGAGMPPDVLAHALDPFFTTKPIDTGGGLGLPQAYGFATQAGGTLVLESQVGVGTVVTFYLPKAGGTPDVRTPPPLTDAPRRATGTVLLVEDDPLVREAVAPALREAGYTVVEAVDAEQALRVLDCGERIDALFSDVVMPGRLNGIDLARRVRERDPDLPVLLASGHTDLPIDLVNVRLIGKPYTVEAVTTLLADAMARSRRN